MIQAYAVADVRAVEDAAMADLPEGVLMARAARGLAQVARVRLRALGGRRVVALVGAGNNGGDALYAVARLARWGFKAAAVVAGGAHPGGLSAARDAGVRILDGATGDEQTGRRWRTALAKADLVLDGITGIGGRPGLREPARDWVAGVPDAAYVIAVDLPSGVDPAGQSATADCVFADETVTFAAAKPGHLLAASEPSVGLLTVVDIGLDFTGVAPAVVRLTQDDVAGLWPVPNAMSDKYSRGVVGMVTGSTAYPGAAVLSVLGALGVGVGMVRYLGPGAVGALVHQHAPEAVTAGGRVQAWVLGSGVDPALADQDANGQVTRIRGALAGDLPSVVDAGALELITQPRSAPTILTPHAGELARLLGRLQGGEVTRDEVLADPVGHSRTVAEHLGSVVVLKGATTLVVSPDPKEPVRSQNDAPAWLATAGAGDVLAGVIGALLAAGLPAMDAAALGVLVHGVAADRANPGGPVRALAVAEALPITVATMCGVG